MLVGQTIGPFVIEKELGSGAMGSVYRARYTKDDRIVALKVIAFGLAANDGAVARFEREGEILKQLKHENIVRLFAMGTWKQTPFFAMEYVDGESLDRTMARRDRFSWQEVITIGKQLCSALQHAHEKEIVHRDLKPSNLMMTKDGKLKLTDFGIAKDIDRTSLTGANNTIGTAAYMSPEQCRGEKFLTGKSDLYSLGIVFFELLTGNKPFNAESPVDMFLMHVNNPAPRVRNQPGCMDVPPALETLIHQLMEKKTDHRPRDAAMVLQVLQEIEEKEVNRQSVGEQVAKGKKHEKVTLNTTDAEDRETAKSIRAGTKKKKVKKQTIPFYRQGWFVMIGAIALLAAMGGTLWLLTRPDSPDEMMRQIEQASNTDAKLAATKKYLDTYGKREDLKEKTETVKRIFRDATVVKRETALLKRHTKTGFRNNPEEGEDPDAYAKTMNAFTAEDDGDVAVARRYWKELDDKFSTEGDETKALWGWVAAKRLRDLQEVDRVEQSMLKLIQDTSFEDAEPKANGDNETRALEAIRLELFGDPSRAKERWERMVKDLKGKTDESRNWFLLAGKKSRVLEVKKDAQEERKKLLQKKLKEAEAFFMFSTSDQSTKTDREVKARLGRNIVREIITLYSGEDTLKEWTQQATDLLKKHPPK